MDDSLPLSLSAILTTPTSSVISVPQPAYCHRQYQHQRSPSISSDDDDLIHRPRSCDTWNAAAQTSASTTTIMKARQSLPSIVMDRSTRAAQVDSRANPFAGRYARHVQATSPAAAQPVLTVHPSTSSAHYSSQASTSASSYRSESPPRRSDTVTSPVNNRYRQQQQHFTSQAAPAMSPTRSRDRATTPLLGASSPQNMLSRDYGRGLIRLRSNESSTCTCSSDASLQALDPTATNVCHCYSHPSSSSSSAFMQARYRCQETTFRFRRAMHIAPGDWTDPLSGRWALPVHLKAYVPLLVWVIVSVAMALIVGIWHTEVFSGALDVAVQCTSLTPPTQLSIDYRLISRLRAYKVVPSCSFASSSPASLLFPSTQPSLSSQATPLAYQKALSSLTSLRSAGQS